MKRISAAQMSCLYVLMLLGNSIMVGVGDQAGTSAWLAIMLGMLLSLPLLLLFARVTRLFPGLTLFQMIVLVLGKTGGIAFACIFSWYGLELGALIIRSITEFIQVVTMLQSPQYVFTIAMILLAIWCVKSGLHVMARCALYGVPIIILISLATTGAGLKDMNFSNILPLINVGPKEFFGAVFAVFAFPFMETLTLSSQLYLLRERQSPYKAVIYGVLIGGGLLCFITIRNTMLLGDKLRSYLVFSGYTEIGIFAVGEFFTRFEAFITATLLLAAFMKVGVCLYISAKGVADIFNIKDYRDTVVPLGMVIVVMSIGFADNLGQLIRHTYIYPYYGFGIQVVLPVAFWILAEIKAKKIKKQGDDALALVSKKLGQKRAQPVLESETIIPSVPQQETIV